MRPMPKQRLTLTYPGILKLFGDYKMKGRKPQKAFIAWFLETYYRLDSFDVDDSICDQPGDKGIDAIYVSELWQQIHVFGCRMFEGKNSSKPLGDTEIKELLGTLTQLKDEATAKKLQENSGSSELTALMERLEVPRLIGAGYEVRGVFVTNRERGQHAVEILAANPTFHLFDTVELKKQYLPIDKVEPIAGPAHFDVSGASILTHPISPGVQLVIAPLLASDLVKMDGIQNQELFAWNLRYNLKRSEVNKAIELSIATPSEHKNFPAFHNGLTVLAKTVESTPSQITVEGYAVVNGCQSLTALYLRRDCITPNLRILTKFVSVSPQGDLARRITDHTNRQNGITGRDLQSNSPLQTRLQTDIHKKYRGEFFYRISRGEGPNWPPSKVIENDEMARVLLAFDVKEPQSSHQIWKLFDELHSDIFGRREVSAERVVALWEIRRIVLEELEQMEHRKFATYSQTPFLMIYLLREALEMREAGGAPLCKDKTMFQSHQNGRARLAHAIRPVIKSLINSVKGFLTMQGEKFDYKKDLKSKEKVREVAAHVTGFYGQCLISNIARPFSALWDESKTIKRGKAFTGELELE